MGRDSPLCLSNRNAGAYKATGRVGRRVAAPMMSSEVAALSDLKVYPAQSVFVLKRYGCHAGWHLQNLFLMIQGDCFRQPLFLMLRQVHCGHAYAISDVRPDIRSRDRAQNDQKSGLRLKGLLFERRENESESIEISAVGFADGVRDGLRIVLSHEC